MESSAERAAFQSISNRKRYALNL